MAELAPDVAFEIGVELRAYEWHPKAAVTEASSLLLKLPSDVAGKVQHLSKKHGLDTSVIMAQALSLWVKAKSRTATAKVHAKLNKEAYKRVHPQS